MNQWSKKAFTLMEVMTVIFILVSLMVMILPNFRLYLQKMKNQEAEQILLVIYAAQSEYARENGGSYTANLADLDIEIDPDSLKNFTLPDEDLIDNTVSCQEGAKMSLARMPANGWSYTLHVLEDQVDDSDDGKIVCVPCDSSECIRMGFENTW